MAAMTTGADDDLAVVLVDAEDMIVMPVLMSWITNAPNNAPSAEPSRRSGSRRPPRRRLMTSQLVALTVAEVAPP